MFKDMKLSTRLTLGFSILLVLMVTVIIFTVVNLSNIQTLMDQIVNVNVYKLNLCEDMVKCTYNIRCDMNEIVLTQDASKIGTLAKDIENQRATYDSKSDAIDKTSASEAGMELRKRIKDNVLAARPFVNNVVELAKAGNTQEAERVLTDKANPAIQKELDSLNEGAKMQNDSNTDSAAQATATSSRTLIIIIILGVVAVAAGIAIAVLVARSITTSIKSIVENLNGGAEQVAAASSQLSATSEQLAEGNAEQAASIQETSSTLEESDSMVRQNSENTKQAALLAAQTKASSDKGNKEMREMMNSMVDIKKSSDQIAKIIGVIDEIAFQTNMLALNAAVEAARAGDAGMGFAVVADEVRNLAQKSAQAAKDTASMIEGNITLSENGVNIAKKVEDSLSEITNQAKKVNELMDEIAEASHEQSQGISQINKAISQLEAVTQQNAANAEESASASEELSAQAANLRHIVKQLTILVNGRNAESGLSNTDASSISVKSPNTSKTAGIGNTALKSGKKTTMAQQEGKKAYTDPEDIIPLNDDTGEF